MSGPQRTPRGCNLEAQSPGSVACGPTRPAGEKHNREYLGNGLPYLLEINFSRLKIVSFIPENVFSGLKNTYIEEVEVGDSNQLSHELFRFISIRNISRFPTLVAQY